MEINNYTVEDIKQMSKEEFRTLPSKYPTESEWSDYDAYQEALFRNFRESTSQNTKGDRTQT